MPDIVKMVLFTIADLVFNCSCIFFAIKKSVAKHWSSQTLVCVSSLLSLLSVEFTMRGISIVLFQFVFIPLLLFWLPFLTDKSVTLLLWAGFLNLYRMSCPAVELLNIIFACLCTMDNTVNLCYRFKLLCSTICSWETFICDLGRG